MWGLMVVTVAAIDPIQTVLAGGGPECRARGIALLRERGPKGLAEAFAGHERFKRERGRLEQVIADLELETQAGTVGKKAVEENEAHQALAKARLQLANVDRQTQFAREAIDQVGGQRGCTVSRLYWYTDMAEAQAAATKSGRPILSLRMLGKLTEEFSCANSRFFRTALYSNQEISQFLRDHYVLHWQSVRPVPRVTIDFGDGRKLKRTLTGNSAHYVLTSGGEPLDVLPGLYSPRQFREWLVRMHEFHMHYASTNGSERAEKLAQFHRERRSHVYRQWAEDVRRLGDHELTLVTSRIDNAIAAAEKAGADAPLAAAASRLAVTKMRAETPLLRYANFSGPWIETSMDDAMWRRIAALHREGVKLDDASVELMRTEFPNAAVAGQLAESKRRQEDPLLRTVRLFEESMALDTVRNEYLLHRRIHEQFADAAAQTANVEALNEWVYAELFLTPSGDPWLGLAPPDVYTALEDDGRVEPENRVAERSGG
jgi:hypothetical protein